MRDSKFGLRAFGLALVAALGLMAFMAVAAQAEDLTDGGKAALFLVELKGELAGPGTKFEVNQVGKGALSVQGRNLGILCNEGIIKGEFKSDTEALGSAEFKGDCLAFEWVKLEEGKKHTIALPCPVAEPILVEKAKALPKKHKNAAGEEEFFVLLEEDGKDFTTVKLSGAECTLPKENLITGSLAVQIEPVVEIGGKKLVDAVEPVILASEKIQNLLGDKLLFGVFPAFLKGEAKGKLTDAAHIGKTVGIC